MWVRRLCRRGIGGERILPAERSPIAGTCLSARRPMAAAGTGRNGAESRDDVHAPLAEGAPVSRVTVSSDGEKLRMSVLIVCSGNTCRSPMAAALLARAIEAFPDLRGRVEVRSAGTNAREGGPATPETIETMRARSIDLTSHRARPATRDLLEWADLVLTMEESHRKECIARGAPEEKVVTLGDFAGTGEEVSDPYGRGPEEYDACSRQLERLVRKVAERLREEPSRRHSAHALW